MVPQIAWLITSHRIPRLHSTGNQGFSQNWWLPVCRSHKIQESVDQYHTSSLNSNGVNHHLKVS